MRTSSRSRRRSRVFGKRDCDFPMLTAINISTCSHLCSKSLSGLLVRWILCGFAILLAHGENRRVSESDVGYSGSVSTYPLWQREVCTTGPNRKCQMVYADLKLADV